MSPEEFNGKIDALADFFVDKLKAALKAAKKKEEEETSKSLFCPDESKEDILYSLFRAITCEYEFVLDLNVFFNPVIDTRKDNEKNKSITGFILEGDRVKLISKSTDYIVSYDALRDLMSKFERLYNTSDLYYELKERVESLSIDPKLVLKKK